MAKKRSPKMTYSVRLDFQTVRALQPRATEQRRTAGAVIRSLVDDYLNERDGEDVLAQMEARIVATIERTGRQRARQRRQAELTLLEVDYIRRCMDFRAIKRLEPNEDPASAFRRSDKTYFDWLQKVFKKRLDLLLNVVTLDEAKDTGGGASSAEPGLAVPAQTSAEAATATDVAAPPSHDANC